MNHEQSASMHLPYERPTTRLNLIIRNSSFGVFICPHELVDSRKHGIRRGYWVRYNPAIYL